MSSQESLNLFKSGFIDLITETELKARLDSKKLLRIKYGADPSAPDLHLGHTVPLRKLKQLQQLGHTVVFIIGDFTARVGDPSQQSETRAMVSQKQIEDNAKTYQEQVFRILDRKKTEVRYNSEWFSKFKPDDFLKLTSQYTVARLLERDDFKKRFEEKRPIAVLEFLYPLLQGHDSVEVKADVEIGGTDQKFNLLVGRDLQKDAGQAQQIVATLPIIEGLDGRIKMSKSVGNAIGILESPDSMFGKLMSVPDTLMIRYWRYLTDESEQKVSDIEKQIQSGALNPREAKANLAEHIAGLFHGKEKAQQARSEFDRVFKNKDVPSQIEEKKLNKKNWNIVDLVFDSGLVSSKSEAKRLVEQGGVELDQVIVRDTKQEVILKQESVLRCGKRRFLKLKQS